MGNGLGNATIVDPDESPGRARAAQSWAALLSIPPSDSELRISCDGKVLLWLWSQSWLLVLDGSDL
jgi:hypothetical protein